jgi:hypothetical protein
VINRPTLPCRSKSGGDFHRKMVAGASALAMLGVSACAGIWGFEDLQASADRVGAEGGVIVPGAEGGGAPQIVSDGGPPRGIDVAVTGDPDARSDASERRDAETLDAASDVADAEPDVVVEVADARDSGGDEGPDGTTGSRDSGSDSGAGDTGPADCGPSNCANGCCAAGRCITVRSTQQCGTGGGACSACGGCELCSPNGACTIDPTSRWIVRCGSAELTAAPPTGATWDPTGNGADGPEPDPFCQFELPSGVIDPNTGAATRTVNDSFVATWNQAVTAGTSTISAADLMSANADSWRVWVGDTEFNGRATLACEVHPPLQASVLMASQLTTTNLQNCVSITLNFVCQP